MYKNPIIWKIAYIRLKYPIPIDSIKCPTVKPCKKIKIHNSTDGK
jgi:hypothetical protein